MKPDKEINLYRQLRDQPLWRLLASDNGPTILALLQSHLYDNERSLPASVFQERIGRDLEVLRSRGETFPQPANLYIKNWLLDGFLSRHFPPNSAEEEYELSTAAVQAIRFVSSMEQPHMAATESRLAMVIQALVKLAEDTDTDKTRRIEYLLSEQERITKEIENIRSGQMRVLPKTSALERTREIISLVDDLAGDFRRVRDKFEELNRSLREKLIDSESKRGEVLDSLFEGIDLISDSEAGRTFNAFYRLLTDPQQSNILEQALYSVNSREFINDLGIKEKRFLLRMTQNLLDQGGDVHDVLQSFARSLKNFVQSREYLEQRRLNQLINDAQLAAIQIKDKIKTIESVHSLELTSSRVRSLSQWVLYDPALQILSGAMQRGDTPTIDLESISELVAQSEIDIRTLKTNIIKVLETRTQVSIGDVLEQFPATQGLGSVVGLISLGCKHGFNANIEELVIWIGTDKIQRSAKISKQFFVRERINELI